MKSRRRILLLSLATLLLVATVAIGINWLKSTRIHVHTAGGMTTFNAISNPLKPATDEQLAEAIRRLLAGKFDVLSVSRGDDPQSAVVLTSKSGKLSLSAFLNNAREGTKVKDLKAALTKLGLPYQADDTGFNGGYAEEFRTTNVEIELPAANLPKAIRATRQIMAIHEPHLPEGNLYISADTFSKKTAGVEFQPLQDPLADLLK